MQLQFTQQVDAPPHKEGLRCVLMNYKKESGKRLKKGRQDKNLSLNDLSKLLGGLLSPSRLSNYEQGIRSMGIKEALALSRVIGVKASYLLCADEEEAEGDMTQQEIELLRNFRALPENQRISFSRGIEVLALAYREPAKDERLSPEVRKGPARTKQAK